MVFGSVALAFRGTTFKVHWLDDPARIICSQVFLAPVQQPTNVQRITPRNSKLNTGDYSSEYGTSMDATSLNSLSLSLCIKDDYSAEGLQGEDATHHSTGDSGYSGTDPWTAASNSSRISNRSSIASIFSESDLGHKQSIDLCADYEDNILSSFGSVQRRITRNLSTSLENRLASADSIGQFGEGASSFYASASELSGASKLRRNSEITEKHVPDVRKRKAISGDALPGRKSCIRRPRLGIAVCLKLNKGYEKDLKLFCSEHMVMLETMMNRIRSSVDSAYINRNKFIHVMLESWHAAAQWLVDLFTAPRIANPVWLSLSTGYAKNANQLAMTFMKDLNTLMSQTDTKDTNL